MKIAYFSPLYFDDESVIGGGERYPLNLATGVALASNYAAQVELISYGPRPFRKELRPGVMLRVLPVVRPPKHPLNPVSWDVPRVVSEYDLIHVHQIFTRSSELVILCAKQQGKPLVYTDHGGKASALGDHVGTLEMADTIVCQSKFAASLLRTKTPIQLVPGGVDAGHFTPPAARPHRKYVSFVGRLLPHKGIDQLIRALPKGLQLKVAGRPYSESYFHYLQKLAEGKWVDFITDANDDQIREQYRGAYANVLPSMYFDSEGNKHLAPELMGFSLLEAMACGTPAICSNVAAMPEFIRHGSTGFVFDSEAELTEQLNTLATEPGLADRLGRNARSEVERVYDLRVCGQQLVRIYRDVIDRFSCYRGVA